MRHRQLCLRTLQRLQLQVSREAVWVAACAGRNVIAQLAAAAAAAAAALQGPACMKRPPERATTWLSVLQTAAAWPRARPAGPAAAERPAQEVSARSAGRYITKYTAGLY